MADKKVSELDAIAGSATAADDLFLIVDASGSVTKKITRAELNNAIEQDVLSTVDINGGTIDSTVIGGTTPAAGDFTTLGATGNITVGGTVDGRDVAADGTKLDGIASSATANPNAIDNIVEDSSPQLGADLDLNSNNITGTGNIDVTGTVTADGLDVQGDGTISGGSRLTISNIADENNDGIRLDDSTTSRFNNLTQDSSGNFKIQHFTGSAWQNNLTITTGGNVQIGTTTEGISDYGDTLTIADSDHCGMTIRSGTSSEGNVYFSDGTSGDAEYKGIVKYDHSSNAMSFWSNSFRRMDITSDGKVGISTTSPESALQVTGTVNTTPDSAGVHLGMDSNYATIELAGSDGGQLDFPNAANTDYRGRIRYTASDNKMAFFASGAGTQTMTVTNTSVGIGTASPSFGTTSSAGLEIAHATRGIIRLEGNSAAQALELYGDSAGGTIDARGSGAELQFELGGSEKARLASDGNLYIAKTSDTATGVGLTLSGGGFIRAVRNEICGVFNRQGSDGTLLSFSRSNSGVGAISVTTSGTTYNTTSDIRLKQDIKPLEATDKLMAMNPVSYSWKADPDGPRSMGFIAQEMEEVMPEAVSTGEDDDAMMSMDYGRITPILVSALQDAHRKIEQLEQRIADMEAK